MAGKNDPDLDMALVRYEVISAYLAMEPARGQRGRLLKQLSKKTWRRPDGEPFRVSAETIRVWVRRYGDGGLDGLRDKARVLRGSKALSNDVADLACKLKKEVPERSLDRIIRIMEDMGMVKPGSVRRSTLHRTLKSRGLSKRRVRTPDTQDLDRFEAACPNDLWQSDMLVGPWLPDPARPGKSRRSYLYACIDDHSRLLLHGRFSFKGDLPALELCLRRCFQKWGLCRRVYYDNGQVYRSEHMRRIVATLGIHRIVFTKPHRPMGHGKIEAFNRYCRSAFLSEIKAAKITTIDALNEAFLAWVDLEYNRKVHSETGQAPIERWREGAARVRYADEEQLRQAFLWRELRTPDKCGLFSLLGVRYQAGPDLAKRRIEVRYDPEQLDLVEIWHKGRFIERSKPFTVQTHRRPKPVDEDGQKTEQPRPEKPAADWLGHLVEKRRARHIPEPSPRQLAEQARARREETDQAIMDLLAECLEAAVFDEPAIRDYLERYGPFEPERAARTLRGFVATHGRDQHVRLYLDAIRDDQGGS